MKFVIEFSTDNAAFEDDRDAEVASILRKIADKIERGGSDAGYCYDTNGNRIGKYSFVRTADETGE